MYKQVYIVKVLYAPYNYGFVPTKAKFNLQITSK